VDTDDVKDRTDASNNECHPSRLLTEEAPKIRRKNTTVDKTVGNENSGDGQESEFILNANQLLNRIRQISNI